MQPKISQITQSNTKGSIIVERKREQRRSTWLHGESNLMFTLINDENQRKIRFRVM